jgi:hypothetical protein
MNSREPDGSPSTLNFGGAAVSSTLAERVPGTRHNADRRPTAPDARALAGAVPLTELRWQTGIRVHSAPNARDLVHRHFAVPAGRTLNPALDARILSSPDSPHGSWSFPEWAPSSA